MNSKKLSTFNSQISTPSKGFTLIELLVVIAVMGVLAAAVFTAINPAKQTQRASDARAKSDIGQFAQALQGYYTVYKQYPPSGTGNYAGLTALTTSGDLKVIPSAPTGSYGYSFSATDRIALSYSLENPVTTGAYWCWTSNSGTASEIASCIP